MRKYKSVEFQFDLKIERTVRRLRKENKNLRAIANINDLQDMGNLNPYRQIQLANGQEGQNGHNIEGQLGNNSIIYMANDRDRDIKDYVVLTP